MAVTIFRVHYLRNEQSRRSFYHDPLDRTANTDIGIALTQQFGYPVLYHEFNVGFGLPSRVEDWCKENDISYSVVIHRVMTYEWAYVRILIPSEQDAVLFSLRWL